MPFVRDAIYASRNFASKVVYVEGHPNTYFISLRRAHSIFAKQVCLASGVLVSEDFSSTIHLINYQSNRPNSIWFCVFLSFHQLNHLTKFLKVILLSGTERMVLEKWNDYGC